MGKEKRRMRGVISRFLAPEDMPLVHRGGLRVEIDSEAGQARIFVAGVERVLVCTEESVILLAGGEWVSFFGSSLTCLTYEGHEIEILGSISSISLERKGEVR